MGLGGLSRVCVRVVCVLGSSEEIVSIVGPEGLGPLGAVPPPISRRRGGLVNCIHQYLLSALVFVVYTRVIHYKTVWMVKAPPASGTDPQWVEARVAARPG